MMRPGLSDVFKKALALHQQGRLAAAEKLYRAVVEHDPGHFDAHSLLGVIASQRQDYAAAAAFFNRAAALNPGSALAHASAGNALSALHRHAEAVSCFQRSLALEPNHPAVLNNLGNALFELARFDEALACYGRSLAIQGGCAEVLFNRGNAYLALGGAAEALGDYDRALTARPTFAEALYNKGTALSALSRHDEAAQEFSRLLELRPDFAYARGELFYSQLHCCDWTDHSRTVARIREEVAAGKRAAAPFVFLSASGSASAQLQCAMIYSRDQVHTPGFSPGAGGPHRHDRIRVAYLSADFHDHATAYLTAELFELHDRSRFETYAISFGAEHRGAMRIRLENAFSHFIDVQGRGDRDVAALLRGLEIDIAVDLKGHTRHSRPGIFAARPAPVQVNYLGYPGTTGAEFMDYVIADRLTIPDGQRRFYKEKVVRVPDTYQPTDTKRSRSDWMPTRAEAGLPETTCVTERKRVA